ncbi:transcription factor FAMA-like [Miscanthus floridulus]|uniref:transcription factor FAMA-like n=1 Tax=Miscanthus floridulus TaxID=154761 RepID=UPI00345A35F9
MVDYMLGHHAHTPSAPAPPPQPTQRQQAVSFDKLSFSDVLQFADFGPKLALNQPAAASAGQEQGGEDADDVDRYFRFQSLPATLPQPQHHADREAAGSKTTAEDGGADGGVSESTTLVQQGDGSGRADKAGDQGKTKVPNT